jgi:DNA helicase IV
MADYYFALPPITSLTDPQQAALNELKPIALSGGPGTGKSFVSLWRHISNHQRQSPIKSQLLTFTTSLAYYLKANSATQNSEAANFVDSTTNWYANRAENRIEIIVDEAQDMPLSFYEDETKLRQFSSRISYGADDKQILKSGAKNVDGTFNINVCSPESELIRVIGNEVFPLDQNFRNSKSILQFARTTFNDAYIPMAELNSCGEIGDKPIFYITNNDIEKQNNTIIDIISQFNATEHNIGILTPLANTPWPNGEILTARYYYNFLKDKFDCSFYDNTVHDGNGMQSMKNIHITTFKSSKGLEFDTVIIPCFDLFNAKFRVISWRDFFVGVTRAKNNLFLFSSRELPTLNSVIDKQQL